MQQEERGTLSAEVQTMKGKGKAVFQGLQNRKEKTTPFCVNLMRSQALYRAAQWGFAVDVFCRYISSEPQKKACSLFLSRNSTHVWQKKLLRLSAFSGASPKQTCYRRPGWPLRSTFTVSRQSLYLLDPPSAHIPSSEQPGIELPTDCSRGSRLNHRLG